MSQITDTSFARITKETLVRGYNTPGSINADNLAYNDNLTIKEKISTITGGEELTSSMVGNIPSGGISSTDVQSALNELDLEKANASNVYTKTESDGKYSLTSHTHTFASLTSKPTTLSGYGITDAYTKTESAARYSQIGHTHTFASLISKPTTLSGYGITDAYTKTESDARYSQIGHTHTFASLTSKPTTLSGYGITDGVITTDPRLSDARTPSNDSNLVHKTGDETIGGVKTLSNNLVVNGNVGIGTATPQYKFHIEGQAKIGEHIFTPGLGTEVKFQFAGANQTFRIISQDGTREILKATEIGDLYVNNQNWTGAWTSYTPTVGGSLGGSGTITASGRYMKMGRTVHVECNVLVSSKGSLSGIVQISLPFTPNNNTENPFSSFACLAGENPATQSRGLAIPTTAGYVQYLYGVDASALTWGGVTDGIRFRFRGIYEAKA